VVVEVVLELDVAVAVAVAVELAEVTVDGWATDELEL